MVDVKSPSHFKQWYDGKKTTLNADRRTRYADDKGVRGKAKASAKNYRQRRAEGGRVEQVRKRMLDGVHVEVFTTGYVADHVGVTSQSIVNWSKRGWVPPCVFEESHRLYTRHQIKQIRRIAKSKRKEDSKSFNKMLESIKTNWRN